MTSPPRVLISKELNGQLIIFRSHPEMFVQVFDMEESVRAVGRTAAYKAFREIRDFVLSKEFSVLLQYPNGDTYYAWVTALDAEGAVAAAKADYLEDHPDENPPEFEVLLVVKGHVDAELRKDGF